MLLITNGTIVDPVQGIYKGDILIRDGKIAKIADKVSGIFVPAVLIKRRNRIIADHRRSRQKDRAGSCGCTCAFQRSGLYA